MKENVKSFGNEVNFLRTLEGIGLRELGRRVGLSPTYLSKVENGVADSPPAEKHIRKIADELAVPADDLMAIAGRVPSDVEWILLKNPLLFEVVRDLHDINPMEVEILIDHFFNSVRKPDAMAAKVVEY